MPITAVFDPTESALNTSQAREMVFGLYHSHLGARDALIAPCVLQLLEPRIPNTASATTSPASEAALNDQHQGATVTRGRPIITIITIITKRFRSYHLHQQPHRLREVFFHTSNATKSTKIASSTSSRSNINSNTNTKLAFAFD